MIQLALDVLFMAETCLMWSWGHSAIRLCGPGFPVR